MEEIINKRMCTGCTACMNICPKKAISMQEDSEGFKYPVIDQDKCINCGLCKKTCPVLNTKNNFAINSCYAAYSKKEEKKMNSSSGGIFSLIANYILDNKGIVIGSAFDNKMQLKHISVVNKNGLNKLSGSKYLQSDLNNVFSYIKENIKNKKILFVGTPCQIAGLKAFLKNDYDNLMCVDLICHGVPSPKLFRKYIDELNTKHSDYVTDYIFRDKSPGWDTYKSFTQPAKDNEYMKLFLSDIALRNSCYNCNFKFGNKYSDITLGDFWGIKAVYPEMYNKIGVSAIIINTNKGKEIFNCLQKNINFKECDIKNILHGNPSLQSSCKKPKKRESFFNNIEYLTIDKLVQQYVPKMNIFKKIINKIKRVIKKYILMK